MTKVFTAFFLLLFFASADAQTAEEYCTDIDILATTLRQAHPVYPYYTDPAQFNLLVEEVKKEIVAIPSFATFYLSTARLCAAMHCSHTYPLMPDSVKAKLRAQGDLPFKLSLVRGRIDLSIEDPNNELRSIGRIRSINGVDVDEIVVQLEKLASCDVEGTGCEGVISRHIYEYLQLIFDFPSEMNFNLGGEFHKQVSFPTGIPLPEILEKENGFHFSDSDPDVIHLDLEDFDSGKRVIRRCFREARKRESKTVLIDVRDNPGGNGNIGSFLLSYLLDSAFISGFEKRTSTVTYADHFERGAGLLISNQQVQKNDSTVEYLFTHRIRRRNHFDGKIIVVMNNNTFSTAAYVTSMLAYKAGATISSPNSCTGGSEYAQGGGVISKLILPNSGVAIKFPRYRWNYYATPVDERSGVRNNAGKR